MIQYFGIANRSNNKQRFERWRLSIKDQKKNGKGFTSWRAVVRITGHPPVCEHFPRKQEAKDWAIAAEAQIKQGKFDFSRYKK
jgi:hypothetical protein